MPKKPTTQQQLLTENQDLRVRLEKSEESLREILSGEADALFVSGVGGGQLFALKGADQSYRTLIENMSEGALTLTPEGLVLYANRRFSGMLGTPLEKVIGSEIQNWFAPESRQALKALLQNDAPDNHREELALAAADGILVPVYLSVSHLHLDGMPDSICMVATDLTERKRNEAILAAEKLSNAILEQAADAIVICDETGRIIRASKQAQALYGKNPIGQLFEHAFPLRQLNGTAFPSVGAIDTSRSLSVEARLECQGQECDLLVRVGYLKGARNELLGSVVTLTDISERKRAEDKIWESKNFLQMVVENVPFRIFWKDRDLRYLGCNTRFAKDAGRSSPSELTGKTDFEMGWKDQAELYRADDKEVLDSDAPKLDIEEPQTTPDGNTIWLSTSKVPLRDKDNQIIGILGLYQDITERRQAEEQMHLQAERLKTTLESITDAFFTVDLKWRFTFLNREAERLLKRTCAELTGLELWTEFPGTIGSTFEREYRRAMADNKAVGFEEFYPPLNTWFDVRAYPSEQGLAVYFRDINEAKRTAEEIKFKNTMLLTQQETSLDAILVVDEHGQIVSYNQQFIALWRLSPQLVSAHLDAPLLQSAADQAENSASFVAGVQYLYEHRDDKSREEIKLKDGRVIDRYSAPVTGADGKYYGRIWYFRDITERIYSDTALRESELRYHSLFENMLEGYAYCGTIFEQDRLSDFIYLEVNDAFYKLTGLKDVVGKKISDVIPGVQKDNPELFQIYGRAALTGQPKKVETYMPALGAWLAVTVYSSDREHFVAVFGNITERKDSEARIIYLNRVYAMLSGINTLIVRVQNRDELFREACRVAVDAGGFRMAMICIADRSTMKIVPVASAGKDEELLTMIKDRLLSSNDVSNTMVGLTIRGKQPIVSNDSLNDTRLVFGKKYAESGVRSLVILPLIVSDETVGTISLYASEVDFFHDEEMKLLTELAGDISFAIDHLDKQTRLNYLAYYDVLTGLANRSLFLERVAQYLHSAVSGGHKLAIGLIDLERFKNINDSLGRPTGDVLLKQVAEWFTHKAGDASVLARIDADHFAIVLPEVKSDGNMAKLVENLIAAFLEHPFRLNDAVLRIGIKVGIALFPDDGTDADTLFRNAEAALKKAKARGDRYLFFTQKMTEAVASKLTLENQLRQAIDNEEFVLHYQPKVNLASGKVTSAEALIRWNDPRTGLVPPGMFIPILEETGLIFEVGRWALHKAMSDYLRWRETGLSAVRIAVNVSPLQLRNINFIDEIKQVIALAAHASDGLELELTESLIMADVKLSIASLQAIRALGVTIAIDDFGTGFSSLSYLAKLPVDTLKIDRSFVIEMNSQEGLALVSTIISLAHALKLKVVAEGVETEEQSRLLRLLSCDEMQGYLFCKPVPAEVFEAKFLAPLTPGDKQ